MSSRALIAGKLGKQLVSAAAALRVVPRRMSHDHGGVPLENLPFPVGNRYAVTLSFALFGATGFWAPSAILWYSMAKRDM